MSVTCTTGEKAPQLMIFMKSGALKVHIGLAIIEDVFE
jgi:hypothetical protein